MSEITKENYTLRELSEKLPKDGLGIAIRAKIVLIEESFKELAKEHGNYRQQARVATHERDKAVAAKKAIRKEKEALRKASEEQLAGIKANVEALRQSKSEPEGFTVIWLWQERLLSRVMRGKEEAWDFYSAIGEVEKVMCPAELGATHNTDSNVVRFFLNNQRKKLEERMAALGLEPEIHVPDEVEDVLQRAYEQLMLMKAHPGNAPAERDNLIETLRGMLVDPENEPGGTWAREDDDGCPQEPDDTTDWEDTDAEIDHIADMADDEDDRGESHSPENYV